MLHYEVRGQWMDPKLRGQTVDLTKAALKSLWHSRYPDAKSFICPLCKRPRRVPFRTEPGSLKHYAWIGFTTLFFTLLTWPWFSWKGIVAFLPIWTVFESIYRWRMRAMLMCSDCGFDPFLMKIDVKWAQREVDAHWRKKFADRGLVYPGPGKQSKRSSAEKPASPLT